MPASAGIEGAILLCKLLRYARQSRSTHQHQDNYTTNFFLPGGAYGQIVSGEYNGTNGVANLVSGQFNLTD
ncbi:MAG: hypothetical protein Q9184_008159, partial [Pyrenodesmia sp. 2 TL-2023]